MSDLGDYAAAMFRFLLGVIVVLLAVIVFGVAWWAFHA